MIETLKAALPRRFRNWLSRKRAAARRGLLPLDRVTDFSALRSVAPYRPAGGWFRGQCVDRYYIESFLATHASDIRGRVLEVADNGYTKHFGGDRVTASDIVDVAQENSAATLIADLADGASLPDNRFDCFICTQTLMYIYDFRAAIRVMHRILAPGGVLLLTVPGICPITPRPLLGAGDDYWRFTRRAARHMFTEVFGNQVQIQTYGNVLSATALLHGLVTQEFNPAELDYHDPDYEVIIAVRAEKSDARIG